MLEDWEMGNWALIPGRSREFSYFYDFKTTTLFIKIPIEWVWNIGVPLIRDNAAGT
jgi:hypothetical protein